MRIVERLIKSGSNIINRSRVTALNRTIHCIQQCTVLLIVVITIILTYQLGIAFGMDKTVHARHVLYSIPGAIGYLNHGGERLYCILANFRFDK